MNSELIPQLEPFVGHINMCKDSLVEVVEQLTHSPGDLDRHCTTRSILLMRLEYVGIAFSGATLMLIGKALSQDVRDEASCRLLERLSVGSEKVVLVERFGHVAERHSTFRPLSEADESR